MLLEHLFEFDYKRRALELQRLILDHPYGEYMNVDLESALWQDAFDGTNIKLGPAVHDIPVIVMRINDKFDHERSDPYGENGCKVVVTNNSIYVATDADDPKMLMQISVTSVILSILDVTVVRRIMKNFVIEQVEPYYYDNVIANKAVSQGLSFANGSTFYRHKSKLTSVEVEVGQLILMNSHVTDMAVIFKVLDIEAGSSAASKESFPSMKAIFERYNVNSLIGLTSAASIIVMHVEEAESKTKDKIFIRKQGASASWSYDRGPCSIALMEKL